MKGPGQMKKEITIEEATQIYERAYVQQRQAEKKAEDYREVDKYRHHKKFHNLIQTACALSVKTNIARRQMVDLMEGSWYHEGS